MEIHERVVAAAGNKIVPAKKPTAPGKLIGLDGTSHTIAPKGNEPSSPHLLVEVSPTAQENRTLNGRHVAQAEHSSTTEKEDRLSATLRELAPCEGKKKTLPQIPRSRLLPSTSVTGQTAPSQKPVIHDPGIESFSTKDAQQQYVALRDMLLGEVLRSLDETYKSCLMIIEGKPYRVTCSKSPKGEWNVLVSQEASSKKLSRSAKNSALIEEKNGWKILFCVRQSEKIFVLEKHVSAPQKEMLSHIPQEDLLSLLEAGEKVSFAETMVVSPLDKKAYLIQCSKDQHGSFSLRATEPKLLIKQQDPLLGKIHEQLSCGIRDGKKNQKPALPLLLQQANEADQASVLISCEGKIYRAIVTKNSSGQFSLSYTDAQFTKEELDAFEAAGFRVLGEGGEARAVRTITSLFKNAMLVPSRAEELREQKVLFEEGEVKKKAEFLRDHAAIQIHVKEDGTITIGISTLVGEGAFNKVWKKETFGVMKKIYAEIIGKSARSVEELAKAAAALQKFSAPHVLAFRKFSQKFTSFFYGTSKQQLHRVATLKTEYCEGLSALPLVMEAPSSPEEQLERLSILHHAAQGVFSIQQKGAAHMDVKPENILLALENETLVAKMGDINPQQEGSTAPATTRAFLDMEGILDMHDKGKVQSSNACDVWALGLSLFEFMYGREQNPFITQAIDPHSPMAMISFRENRESLLKTLDDTKCSKKINALIVKMLTLTRAKRPELNEDLLNELQEAMTELSVQA